MTPFAAQMFRAGDENTQGTLAKCQFFECTKIVDLAYEMAKADVEVGESDYSLMAQLPAPVTAIEFFAETIRVLLIVEQHADEIHIASFFPGIASGKPGMRFMSGFILGTKQNTEITWIHHPGEPRQVGLTKPQADTARSFNLLVEKMLLIINQPGLVDRVEQQTDRRVRRIAKTLPGKPDVPKFFECRIRPGHHGDATGESGIEMPLHYVRKHLRPSSGKWIDGYWRGNADLGIHLKWYSPPTPAKGGR